MSGKVYSFDEDISENNAKTYERMIDLLKDEVEGPYLDKLVKRGKKTLAQANTRKAAIATAKAATIAKIKNRTA